MNTKWLYFIALSVAVGGLMWQLGGFGDLFAGSSPGDQLQSSDEVEGAANDSALDRNFTGDASPQDGSLVGLALSGVSRFVEAIGFIAALPGQLLNLGLPYWAARPLGDIAIILGGIAIVQFASNRIWS